MRAAGPRPEPPLLMRLARAARLGLLKLEPPGPPPKGLSSLLTAAPPPAITSLMISKSGFSCCFVLSSVCVNTGQREIQRCCDCRVADPGCLSRILIFTHPGSRIQKQEQKRGVKTKLLTYLFCSHRFHKIVIYFMFENAEETNLGQFLKNYRTFYHKHCH